MSFILNFYCHGVNFQLLFKGIGYQNSLGYESKSYSNFLMFIFMVNNSIIDLPGYTKLLLYSFELCGLPNFYSVQ